MWTYHIPTGELRRAGVLFATGYAGRGAAKNDARQCGAHLIGPLPPGLYTIGEAIDSAKLGPFAMPLTPDPLNQMLGRSGFFIHADSLRAPGDASEGCIVIPDRQKRIAISLNPDRDLLVLGS